MKNYIMGKFEELETLYVNNRCSRCGQYTNPMEVFSTIENFNERNHDERSFLHLAVENLDMEGVQLLLSKGVTPDVDKLDNNLFHSLANSPYLSNYKDIIKSENQAYDIANLLVSLKVKAKRKNSYDQIAYVKAADRLAYPIIKAIAESGLTMDAPKENGMNLIHAILESNGQSGLPKERRACVIKTVIALIESGLDPEDKDALGYDVEHYARRGDFREIIAYITGDESASTNGSMSLIEALTKKEFDIAQALLNNGANINDTDEKNNSMTPLMWFCYNPNPEAVAFLVKNNADINYISGDTQQSALSLLIKKGYANLRNLYLDSLFTIYRILCKGGANLKSTIDGEGNTALNLLCQQRNMEGSNTKIAEILIDADADVNLANLEGQTPLMSFARCNGKELELGIIELLLDEDANVTTADRYGNTALMYAASTSNDADAKKMAALILDADESTARATNNSGKTAMDIAIAANNEACVKTILMKM